MKPYKPKTLKAATRRIRELDRQIAELVDFVETWPAKHLVLIAECNALAKLAASGPAFFNPLEALAAKDIRDRRLAAMGMHPDGTFLTEAKTS